MTDSPQHRQFRTLFISDIHLGTRGCQADRLLDFLRHHDADTIYLVGDIVDGWRLRRSWYWPQSHSDVVQKLLRKTRKGARMIYIPGNHDEFLRNYFGTHFGGIEVVDRIVHETAAGEKLLVIHGDQFDVVVAHMPWLSHFGDQLYRTALAVNAAFNFVRRRMGLSYWSLSAWAKGSVKNAVNIIGRFEEALVDEARRDGVDGVLCGHIHHAALHHDFGIRYVNTGDWVESCTAIGEHADGTLEILRWNRHLVGAGSAPAEVEEAEAVEEAKELAAA